MVKSMKKKAFLVEKRAFDETLAKLLKMKPIHRTEVRTKGRRGPKTPILSPKP